jgi:hypothetical protein
MNGKEVWKDIIDYEGLYQVSDLGRVKSLSRSIIRSDGFVFKAKSMFLKQYVDKQKYHNVWLYKNSKRKAFKVHVLVATMFLNYNSKNTKNLVVDHKSNLRNLNSVNDIQIITNRENCSKNRKDKITSSKYIGVCFDKHNNKWKSSIYTNKKRTHLGYFKTELEAHQAYQKELNKINSKNNTDTPKLTF